MYDAIDTLQEYDLVEAFASDADRYWLAVTSRGKVVLLEPESLGSVMSTLEYNTLLALYRFLEPQD